MRGGRSLIILLVVALGLGAYVFLIENKREPAGDTSAVKKEKVFTVDTAKIQEITLKAESGDTTTLTRKGAAWEITAPEAIPTDSGEAGQVVSNLESLEVNSVVDEKPAALKDYGLDPPRFTVSFKAEGAAAPTTLQVGKKTPAGSDLYARVEGQPRVFLISGFQESSLNKTTFSLRDKTILKFERDAANTVTVEKEGSPTLTLVKKGEDWRLTKPYDAKADPSAADILIGKLSQARMTALETADGTKDLKKYGLDKPQATATVGAGSARATLAIGAKKDDGSLYARDLSRPAVFTVEGSLLDDLSKKAEDLRKKDVFEFRAFNAHSIEFTYAGKTFAFEKQKGPAPAAGADQSAPPPADVWKQTKPEAKDADQTKLTDLMTTLSNLKAEKFVEKPLTSGEEFSFTATFGSPESLHKETVRFRKSGNEAQAMISGESGAAVVSTADYDRAIGIVKGLAGMESKK
jgi:hypothetical protein